MAKRIEGPNSPEAKLKAYIERIENLRGEKQALQDDIREIFDEAKSAGFNPKIMRALIKIRSIEPATFEQEIAETNTYLEAVGMPRIDLSTASDL